MEIRIYSDLHLELGTNASMFSTRGNESLVVLAGDIDSGTAGVRWAKNTFPHVPVVYFLGNHEFYDHIFEALVDEWKNAARASNVHMLERNALAILGIRVLGCTLWTDFDLLGAERSAAAQDWARESLTDYENIRLADGQAIYPEQTAGEYLRIATWLNQQIEAADRPVLVVTHHAPTAATTCPIHRGRVSSAAFNSNADRLIRPSVKMWVHGHTHYNADVQVNRVRVVTNQRGRPGETVARFRGNGLYEWSY